MQQIGKIMLVHLLLFGACFCLEEEKEKMPRLDLADIASELLGRQSNSQVLSLNLTNLVILLVLKGLLFGYTVLGTGHGKGRALDSLEEPLISEAEILLITSYLMGDAEKDYSCLYRIACQEPKKSKEYLNAAKILLKTSKIFSEYIDYNDKYEELVRDLQEAIEFGSRYGTCHQKYSCNKADENQKL